MKKIFALLFVITALNAAGADWKEVQKIKLGYIQLMAQHAMDQQKRFALPTINLPFPDKVTDSRKMKLISKSGKELKIKATDILSEYKKASPDVIHFSLTKPMDFLSKGSGITVQVKSDPGSSSEIRLGLRFIGKNGKIADITPYIPVVDSWGDPIHEIYFDWGFINYSNVNDAIEVLKNVEAIEFLIGAVKRAPQRGPCTTPQSAFFSISDMKLVDYLKGSFDPARHSWKEGVEPDLTLQQRCQEVTGVVASYGGKEGIKSALESLDFMARTQCWDGSFLDGRRGASTVVSGEYTYGFAIYAFLTGYLALEQAKIPQLDEKITIGSVKMLRRDIYKRMFYRAALSRERICGPSNYRDDIIGGNTLITGANRVLGYAIGMRMVADIFPEGEKRKEILSKFEEIMTEIMDAQGKFSGSFPILAEGDRFNGSGIHYDAGYTRTHMDWLIIAAQRTGDPRFIEMLRKYQDVFVAVMDSRGSGLLTMLSERGHSDNTMGSVELVIPDATAQVGMKYKLPVIAQWGYNNGMAEWLQWNDKSSNFWSSKTKEHGYTLGAHSGRLLDDFNPDPEPRDLGFLFPRQMPIWSTTLYNKKSQPVSTSHVYIKPDGTMANDYKIEIGLYPETVGVPVSVKSTAGTVIATAIELDGWPKLLPVNAELTVNINGEMVKKIKPNTPLDISIDGKAVIIISGADVQLPKEANDQKIPFKAVFTLEPQGNQKKLPVSLTLNRDAVKYNHQFIDLSKN